MPVQLAPEEFFSPQYISQRLSATVSLIYNAVLSRVIMEVNKSQYDDLEDLDDFTKCAPTFPSSSPCHCGGLSRDSSRPSLILSRSASAIES